MKVSKKNTTLKNKILSQDNFSSQNQLWLVKNTFNVFWQFATIYEFGFPVQKEMRLHVAVDKTADRQLTPQVFQNVLIF